MGHNGARKKNEFSTTCHQFFFMSKKSLPRYAPSADMGCEGFSIEGLSFIAEIVEQ